MNLDRLATFIGEIARPSTLHLAGWSSAVATVTIPFRTASLSEGAVYIGAAWAGTAALYTAKAWEQSRTRKAEVAAEADVEIARSGVDRRQPQPVEVVNRPDEPVPTRAAE
ncbi:hypothetical protein [Brevundimonas viscosa]|uniref:Uncharacterized protein n=1 Tax=Brevundimonas viscosa TaxID=871741 RepID=A0A1I6PPU5_9CAUL|nr:hypothetical protein [Brevundimonas viscosa]SFS42065.1 hypothetical protein SAMN05192570_1153 [Brevundimonas viscosa]